MGSKRRTKVMSNTVPDEVAVRFALERAIEEARESGRRESLMHGGKQTLQKMLLMGVIREEWEQIIRDYLRAEGYAILRIDGVTIIPPDVP